jgi:hypothetical protein
LPIDENSATSEIIIRRGRLDFDMLICKGKGE